ncbi:MAG: YdcH family protein [Bryobacteraceae bacterium]
MATSHQKGGNTRMELTNEMELKAHLIETDPSFRALSEEHTAYDRQLVELENKDHLTDDEQMEEVRLKKLKLHAKDQMRAIMAQRMATTS